MAAEPNVPALLYVEDEVLIQTLLVSALEEAGFHVAVANDGTRALALLETDSTFDGLVTDINLGKGPDGWDVSRRARERFAGLPVVYVSAASEAEWTSRGVPGSVMIAKPFVPAQVVVAIASLLVVSD